MAGAWLVGDVAENFPDAPLYLWMHLSVSFGSVTSLFPRILFSLEKCLFIMETAEQPQEETKVLSVEELSIDILPVIYEIIRSVERDHHDTTAKTRESQDCALRVLELQKRLDQARAQIRLLPGIDFSKEQQLQNLESLKTQLRLKQELVQKYRYMYPLQSQK